MLSFQEIFVSLLPVPLFILLYQRHFLRISRYSVFFDAFLYGILQAALLLLAFPWIDDLISSEAKVFTGFVNAALIEKSTAFLFLYYLFSKQYSKLNVNESVCFGMFLGIGFSALENIFYAIQTNSSMIFLRMFTSVPLHITTCGIIAYYLALRQAYNTPINRITNLILAYVIPLLFHGIYDSCLLIGNQITYIIGPELVFLILALEYLMARAISLPHTSELQNQKISLEDWEAIQLQPQYERWIIRSMGKKNAEFVPFFSITIGYKRGFVIFLLLMISVVFYLFQPQLIFIFDLKLNEFEMITLFAIYPIVLAFNLFLLGAINPEYFRNSIISIPIIMEVNVEKGLDTKSMVGSEVSSFNSFLRTFDTLEIGHEMEISYLYSDFKSPTITGRVIWDNHEDFERPMGSIVRFDSLPKGFLRFLFQYQLYKLGKGILYNLKFPGFKKIRKLFVKESTVMEHNNYYTAGTILFKEGDTGRKFYLLKKGSIEICKHIESGEKITLGFVESGEIFGEMSILGNQPRTASAICMTNCVVATADGDNLEALIKGNPDFSLKLIQTLATRIGYSERLLKSRIQEVEDHLNEEKRKNKILEEQLNKLLPAEPNIISPETPQHSKFRKRRKKSSK